MSKQVAYVPRPHRLAQLLLAGMIGARMVFPGPALMDFHLALAKGLAIAILGMAITLMAEHQLHRAGTTVETFGSPTLLVFTGAFSRSRNPIYLGITVILVGVALMLNQPYGLIAAGFFLLACNFGYIPHEESRMRAEFGTDYETYMERVRRWI